MSSRHNLRLGVAAGLLALCASCDRPPPRAAPTTGTVRANGVTLTPASIELPADDAAFPEAPGAEAVRLNCTACHSSAMILSQPRLTRAQWQAEVEKMQKAYYAPVDANEVPAIVNYLVELSEHSAAPPPR